MLVNILRIDRGQHQKTRTWGNSEGRGDFRPFIGSFDVRPLCDLFSTPYLALIARRIYGNPEISLAGLNIILHRRMEAGNGLFDDKAKVRASSTAELESAGNRQDKDSINIALGQCAGTLDRGIWEELLGAILLPPKP